MKAAIIIIGDEILLGQVKDTNSGHIAEALINVGVRVNKILTVGDSKEEILSALKETSGFYDFIFVTGGLGPTKDDITKYAFLEYFGGELVLDKKLLAVLKSKFKARGWKFHESNLGQAEYPDSCEVIPNERGSAQGMLFCKNNSKYFAMPGVPHEMEGILHGWILPYLKKEPTRTYLNYISIGTIGISESGLSKIIEPMRARLGQIEIAYLPGYYGARLRLTAEGADESEVKKRLGIALEILIDKIETFTYSTKGENLSEVIGHLMREKALTLAVSESCTGGLIQDHLTDVPGSSDYYIGGVVAYSNDIKVDFLGVKPKNIERFGAVSSEIAEEMAKGIRMKMGSDIGLSITGIAGPGGGSKEKPVGLVYIGYSDIKTSTSNKYLFGDDRIINKKRSAGMALGMLWKNLKELS